MKKEVLTSAFLDIRSKMHRIAIRFLHDDEDARDAIQDTFEKLWSKDEVESNEEARSKLVHVLRNTCIDRTRRKHTVALEDPDVAERGYEIPIEDMDKYERLISNGLTDLQRQIYNMVVHDCLEYDEIARRLDMSVEAVRTNMSRARKRIRENIKMIEQ